MPRKSVDRTPYTLHGYHGLNQDPIDLPGSYPTITDAKAVASRMVEDREFYAVLIRYANGGLKDAILPKPL